MPDHHCDDALSELYRFLDGELDATAKALIEAHLHGCSSCLEAFDFEAELRKVIRSRCQETASAELRAKVLAAIEECRPDEPV